MSGAVYQVQHETAALGWMAGLEAQRDNPGIARGEVERTDRRATDLEPEAARALEEGRVERLGRADEHLDALAAAIETSDLGRPDLVDRDLDPSFLGDRRRVAESFRQSIDSLVRRRRERCAERHQRRGIVGCELEARGPVGHEAHLEASRASRARPEWQLHTVGPRGRGRHAGRPLGSTAALPGERSARRWPGPERSTSEEAKSERVAVDLEARRARLEGDLFLADVDLDPGRAAVIGRGARGEEEDGGEEPTPHSRRNDSTAGQGSSSTRSGR